MKKCFVLFLVVVFSFLLCAETYAAKSTPMYKRVNQIGHKILESNGLPVDIKFKMKRTNKVNAYANTKKEVYVFSGLIKLCDDDDELAGIISHEIGHILNSHLRKMNAAALLAGISFGTLKALVGTDFGGMLATEIAMKKWSRSDEFEADITGVDLMVRAGYNPLAMVSIMQKISKKYIDIISTHPSGEKRTMLIYDYIARAYPEYIEKGYESDAYDEFMVYANSVIQKRKTNPEKQVRHTKKMSKLQEKRQIKYQNYQKTYTKKQRRGNYIFKPAESL